jgi:hypothetical protein
MDKEIEKALKELEEELKWTHNDGVNLTKYDEERFNVIKQALTTKSKKEQAFDIIKENFDIEAIVIKDYCYIEITSKICVMSKTQRAIKINPENKDKVEALKEVLKSE